MFKSWLGVCLTILLASTYALSATDDKPLHFASGENRVVLLELFTSEGCSSCPPADQWLSKLKNKKGLWQDYIPIAFHVDYWDYIGWQDRFASADNSNRQRRYAQEGGVRFVYTPGFVNDGMEWVGWREGKSVKAGNSYAGNLSVMIDGNDIAVRFDNTVVSHKKLSVHIAVLGMGVKTSVRAGENKGRILKHDFVALDVVSTPLKQSGGSFRAVAELPLSDKHDGDKALVAWVSSSNAQAPLQAVGGLLPGF